MLDAIIGGIIGFLPNRLQWLVAGICGIFLIVFLSYLWSEGRLTW
jgi:hypothetical protein